MKELELLPITIDSDASVAIHRINGEPIALIVSGREMRTFEGKLDLLIENKLSRLRLLLGLATLPSETERESSAPTSDESES